MSLKSKMRFFVGIIIVLALVTSLFVYLNYSISRVSSRTGYLSADEYVIGTDYSGILTKQYVSEGDSVNRGDKLFELQSEGLTQENLDSLAKSANFDITDNGSLELLASEAGVVSDIEFSEGAFINEGRTIATVQKADSIFVVAHYRLSPPDYARLQQGNKVYVTLPDNQRILASVYDISLINNEGTVETVVKARFDQAPRRNYTFAIDTPVSTILQLEGKTVLQMITDQSTRIFTPGS